MVPERFRWLIGINPMYPFIELYHQVLLRHRPALGLAAAAVILAALSLLAGAFFFHRARRAFADVL
jgi:lipopolysaccharide transport system permease protein